MNVLSFTGNPELRNLYCMSYISFVSGSTPFIIKYQVTILAPCGDTFPTHIKRIQIYSLHYLTTYKKTHLSQYKLGA